MQETIEIFIPSNPPAWWGQPEPNDVIMLYNINQTNMFFQVLSIDANDKGVKMELQRITTLAVDILTGNGSKEFIVYWEKDKTGQIIYRYPPEESQYNW